MRRKRILDASVRALQEVGLAGWSIDRVARGAGCAKGLVIHHFGSRSTLLAETAGVISRTRAERWLGALSAGAGTAGLDRLWSVLLADAGSGLTRAALALAAQGLAVPSPEDGSRIHQAAADCLGIPADSLADRVSLLAMLDGIELQIMAGTAPALARAAYDRLWIAMIEG